MQASPLNMLRAQEGVRGRSGEGSLTGGILCRPRSARISSWICCSCNLAGVDTAHRRCFQIALVPQPSILRETAPVAVGEALEAWRGPGTVLQSPPRREEAALRSLDDARSSNGGAILLLQRVNKLRVVGSTGCPGAPSVGSNHSIAVVILFRARAMLR